MSYGGTIDEVVSWDELFSLVGPDLFDEASELVMRKRLTAWLTNRYAAKARQLVIEALEESGKKVRKVDDTRVEFALADFGTLVVQFRALGLIEKSTRNRSVSDRATYWKLTPYGEEHLTTLRAIKAEDVDLSDEIP